jgi:hypothetical protein
MLNSLRSGHSFCSAWLNGLRLRPGIRALATVLITVHLRLQLFLNGDEGGSPQHRQGQQPLRAMLTIEGASPASARVIPLTVWERAARMGVQPGG